MSNEGRNEFAMRSRVARTSSEVERDRRRDSPTYKDIVMIDRKIKPGDTLNKLSIQYAVNVADIKRANNLVSDVGFLALSNVKIPVSRMRHALGVSSSSDDDDHRIDIDERERLMTEDRSRDPSVEEIFHKTDTAIAVIHKQLSSCTPIHGSASVREALPDNGIPGSFHFVDARPPDSGCSVWLLLAGVVIMFMIIPLVLTLYEEQQLDVDPPHGHDHNNLAPKL